MSQGLEEQCPSQPDLDALLHRTDATLIQNELRVDLNEKFSSVFQQQQMERQRTF